LNISNVINLNYNVIATQLQEIFIMSHSNFNMRLDDDLKASAFSVLEQYGLTPTQAVRMFFNEIAHTKSIPLSLDWASYTPNTETVKAIKQGREDYQAGKLAGYQADELTDALVDRENG
jgi:RHH-type transcriptional regulator, rel operon repressor / antitoxin RelB